MPGAIDSDLRSLDTDETTEEKIEVESSEEILPEQDVQKWDDRDGDVDPTSDVKLLKDIDDKAYVLLPSTTYNAILKLVTNLTLIKDIKAENLLTKEDIMAQGVTAQSGDKTMMGNTFADRLNQNPDAWVNELRYGEKVLGTRPIGVTYKPGSVSGATAVAKFTSAIGVGDVVQQPLWHSGFWVTIKPATQTELVNLERAIATNEIQAGRETNTLVYSNYSVIINRILVDFILGHITDVTIKLSGDDNLLDFISVHDLQPLVLGIITSMHPNGFEYIRPCINASVLVDENQNEVTPEQIEAGTVKVKAKCSHFATGRLDPKKLMKLNRLLISNTMREHMSKRMPQSTTPSECAHYRSLIRDMDDKVLEFNASNGVKVIFTLCIPTLRRYIDIGEEWMMRLIGLGEELFSKTDTAVTKNAKINEIVAVNSLGLYNSFVKKLSIDGEIVSDETTVNEILEMFTNDIVLFDSVMDAIKDYISLSPIALPAIANYNCTVCTGDQNPDMAKTPFKELIPLNLIESFFDLSALRMQKVRRSIS